MRGTSRRATLTSGQLSMFDLPTLPDTPNATSSPASASGPTLSDAPAGPTTAPSGPVAALARPSRRQEKDRNALLDARRWRSWFCLHVGVDHYSRSARLSTSGANRTPATPSPRASRSCGCSSARASVGLFCSMSTAADLRSTRWNWWIGETVLCWPSPAERCQALRNRLHQHQPLARSQEAHCRPCAGGQRRFHRIASARPLSAFSGRIRGRTSSSSYSGRCADRCCRRPRLHVRSFHA